MILGSSWSFIIPKTKHLLEKMKKEKNRKERYVSAVVIHEVYKLSLVREGREIAKLKVAVLKQDFKILPIDSQIAEISAEIGHKYKLSMGNSMIAATVSMLDAVCISDDPHFQQIKEIKTTWF